LGADFVAAVQVLVYAGAIMVLFLFVIMLLNLDPNALRGPKIPPGEVAVMLITALGFLVIGVMVYFSRHPELVGGYATDERIAAVGGNTHVVGTTMFINYLWAFELASFLILMAIIASIVIARKEKPADALNQKDEL